MARIVTNIVSDAHPYTRSKSRWRLDTAAKSARDRLYHYLSGGGMKAFGRTIKEEEASDSQSRFLAVASVVGIIWMVLWATG